MRAAAIAILVAPILLFAGCAKPEDAAQPAVASGQEAQGGPSQPPKAVSGDKELSINPNGSMADPASKL